LKLAGDLPQGENPADGESGVEGKTGDQAASWIPAHRQQLRLRAKCQEKAGKAGRLLNGWQGVRSGSRVSRRFAVDRSGARVETGAAADAAASFEAADRTPLIRL
jgi:hypothetical protein